MRFFFGRNFLLAALLTLGACSHPLEIIGEGDITSASGLRDCSLEEFRTGAEKCSVNNIVGHYDETYTAIPRPGWTFDRWFNGCNGQLGNVCTFNVPAEVIDDNWGNTAAPLIAKFREETTGYNSLFIGHSFFRPFAEGMQYAAIAAGFPDHSQTVFFSGNATGAPEAFWNDSSKRASIQAVLNSGDVELFGMTYHPAYPDITGYEHWVNYALAQNSETRIFIAIPWLERPHTYDATTYHETWKQLYPSMFAYIDTLRQQHPAADIFAIPYGQAAGELYTRLANGELPDVQQLQGTNGTGIVTDNKGHADQILIDLGQLVWLYSIYGVRPLSFNHGSTYITDLKLIADKIIRNHDPLYDSQ